MSAINTSEYRDTMGAYGMFILTQKEGREGWREAGLLRGDTHSKF